MDVRASEAAAAAADKIGGRRQAGFGGGGGEVGARGGGKDEGSASLSRLHMRLSSGLVQSSAAAASATKQAPCNTSAGSRRFSLIAEITQRTRQDRESPWLGSLKKKAQLLSTCELPLCILSAGDDVR